MARNVSKRWVLIGAVSAGAWMLPGLALAQSETTTTTRTSAQDDEGAPVDTSAQHMDLQRNDDTDMKGTGGSGPVDDSDVRGAGHGDKANPDREPGTGGAGNLDNSADPGPGDMTPHDPSRP